MSEETIEELTARRDALIKENLEREIAKEKAKADEAAELEAKKKEEELRAEIKSQVLEEMQSESKVINTEPDVVDEKRSQWDTIKNDYVERFNENPSIRKKITGNITYEQLGRKLATGGYKEARKQNV